MNDGVWMEDEIVCALYSGCNVMVLQMCVTANDLEYVRRSLSVLGAELHVETVLEAVEAAIGDAGRQQWRQALYAMLEGAVNQLEARALQVINRVAAKVSHHLLLSRLQFQRYCLLG